MQLKITALLAASMLAAAAAANAADTQVRGNVGEQALAINYSDLDLSSEAGNRILYKRIRAAAEKVCPVERITGSRLPVHDRQCIEEAVAKAVNGIQSPKLAQMHATHTHRLLGG